MSADSDRTGAIHGPITIRTSDKHDQRRAQAKQKRRRGLGDMTSHRIGKVEDLAHDASLGSIQAWITSSAR